MLKSIAPARRLHNAVQGGIRCLVQFPLDFYFTIHFLKTVTISWLVDMRGNKENCEETRESW